MQNCHVVQFDSRYRLEMNMHDEIQQLVQHLDLPAGVKVVTVAFHTSTLAGRQWPTFRSAHDLYVAMRELLLDKPGGWLFIEIMPSQGCRMRSEHVVQTIRTCSREVSSRSSVVAEDVLDVMGRRFVLMKFTSDGGVSLRPARREQMVADALDKHGLLTTRQLYTMLGWTRPTTRRVLLRLIEAGDVQAVDPSTTSPTQRYRLSRPTRSHP